MSDLSAVIVERARAGEARAFDELVERHRPGLVRSIHLLIRDADEAESLAQETLTRALSQLDAFRAGQSFGAWLRGIAVNLCRMHLRSRARHARVASPESLDAEPARAGRRRGVLSAILQDEVSTHLDDALQELPEALREAFVLHAADGLSYDEIGEILGVTPGTARVRAHRARTLLRGSLGAVVDTWFQERNRRAAE